MLILSAKIFSIASAAVYPSVSTVSVRNGRSRTLFLDVQYQIFLGFASSTVAARRRTYVVRRRIFSPLPAKASSISINTTVDASMDPARAKAVTVSPRGFFPTDACAYVTWVSPGVALLVSTARFGNYVHTHLNFEPDGLSK